MPEAYYEGSEGGSPVTTPGGVANLPPGALTLDTMESQLQDTSVPAVRERAAARMPTLFDSSNGGNPLSDLTPFGILTKIFAAFNSSVAGADPADVTGPEDLPGLLWEFVENLPVVGQLVGLVEAILGTYDGDDEVLLAIQDIFMPIRRLLQLITGQDVDFPTMEEIEQSWEDLFEGIGENLQQFKDQLTGFVNSTDSDLDNWLLSLVTGDEIPASSITTRTMNLQRNHNFASESILSAPKEGVWSLDPDNRKGLLGNGLKVVGGGFNWIALPKVRVSAKQGVSVNAYVKWEGVTGPEASVVVYVNPVGGVSSGWQFLENRFISGTEGTWIELGGDYTIVDEDVEYVETILSFTDATAGTVWFSETSTIKPLAPGTIPGVLVDGLEDGLDAVGEFAQSIGMVVIKALTGLPFIGWLFEDLEEALSDFWDDTQVTAGQASDAKLGLADLTEDIVGGLSGLLTGRTPASLIKNQQDTIAAQAAKLAEIQDKLDSAENSTLTAIDRFEYTDADSLDPALWESIYLTGSADNGYTTVDGHNAIGWHGVTRGPWEQLHRFIGPNAESETDYQKAGVVLAEVMQAAFPLDTRRTVVNNYVRLNAAKTSWMRLRIESPSSATPNICRCIWQWRVDGGAIQSDGAGWKNFDRPSVGADPFVLAGTGGGVARFEFRINNQLINDMTNSGVQTGVANRFRGWGIGYADDPALAGFHSLPKIVQWSSTDNAAAETMGSYAKVARTNTAGTVAIPSDAAFNSSGVGVFNSVVRRSKDILYFSNTNRFQVTETARYQFAFAFKTSTSPGGIQEIRLGAFIDDVIDQWKGAVLWQSGTQDHFGADFTVYLQAGQYIAPGVHFANDPVIVGTADGAETFMTLAKFG